VNKARIGVIGVGWWGTVGHLEPLVADDRAEVVAIWSRTEGKARERAAKYGVPWYDTDYRRLIDECALDGVVVASTPNMHYEQARYALEHGLHVLMEKPFVLSAAHANELDRLARERGLLLSVCHPALYHPQAVEARRLIRSELGELLMVTAVFAQRVYDLYKGDVATVFDARPGSPRPNTTSYSDPSVVGGGEGHTQASHIIGTVLWLTGLEPVSAFAYMHNAGLAVDVVDAMTIRFRNGALATVAANGLLPNGVAARLVHVQGDAGILSMDSLSGRLHLFTDRERGPRAIEAPVPPDLDSRAAVPRNFVRAILGEEPLHVETAVAIDESRILDAAYRSAASGLEAAIER